MTESFRLGSVAAHSKRLWSLMVLGEFLNAESPILGPPFKTALSCWGPLSVLAQKPERLSRILPFRML